MTDRAADKPIAVGDLVAVVRGCCGRYVGIIRRVEALSPNEDARCPECGYEMDSFTKVIFDSKKKNMPFAAPLNWCQRIPPLSELESSKTDEPMKEPA